MEIKRNLIEDALKAIDIEDIREDYIGRGMYGKSCFGFVGTHSDLIRFFIALVWEAAHDLGRDEQEALVTIDLADELAQVASSDDMGRDTIFYFPGYTLSE